jgi:hypothetical protein
MQKAQPARVLTRRMKNARRWMIQAAGRLKIQFVELQP